MPAFEFPYSPDELLLISELHISLAQRLEGERRGTALTRGCRLLDRRVELISRVKIQIASVKARANEKAKITKNRQNEAGQRNNEFLHRKFVE